MARRVVYRLTNTVRYDRKSRGHSHTVTGQRAHIIDQPKMPDVLFVSFLLLFLSFFSPPTRSATAAVGVRVYCPLSLVPSWLSSQDGRPLFPFFFFYVSGVYASLAFIFTSQNLPYPSYRVLSAWFNYSHRFLLSSPLLVLLRIDSFCRHSLLPAS